MTVQELFARSALFAALARWMRCGEGPGPLASEVPPGWDGVLRGIAARPQEEYSRLLGGTGVCPDGEISYRTRMPGGTILADIAGFYRAFGFPYPEGGDEKPDHIATELEFVAFLLAKEARALVSQETEAVDVVQKARRAFLTDHLATWIGGLAAALRRHAPDDLRTAAAQAAAQAVAEDVPVEAPSAGEPDATEFQCGGLCR